MKRVTLPAGGLATDPNPYVTAAQGGMRRADEVIFKHPNVATLRPSFPVVSSRSTTRRPRSMHVYESVAVVAAEDVNGTVIETATDTLDTSAPAPDDSISPTQFVEARGNLYYTSSSGVRKVTSTTDTGVAAGLLEAPSASPVPSTAAGSVLPTGYVWGYRACFVRKDANDVIVRSAPSPWVTYENASGGTVVATWTFPLAPGAIAGDVVELYRSLAVATGSTPSDVLFLSNRAAITGTNVSNGYVTIADLAAEADLGAELYTNSTREGAQKANYAPPVSVALARFGSCVWYGNTKGRHSVAFQLRRPMASSVASSNANGVCAGTRDATGTLGDAFFTMAGGTGGIHIGMYVWDAASPDVAGTYFDANTTVTNIVGTTVSISKVLLGSPAGATVNIGDGVTVDGELFYAVPAASWTAGTNEFPVYVTGDHAYDVGKMAEGLAYNINLGTALYAYATEDALTAGSIIIREEDPTAASFAVSWTTDANSASEGSIVSLAADLSQTSAKPEKPNRVYYSKPDEPEHVPLLNYLVIGEETAPILAMARSRNALIVFKRDGIFKVTGSAPGNWRVDEIDTATRVLRGSCVSEVGGLIYAWTNRGAVAVSELGVQNLSARAISRELDPFGYIMSESSNTKGCFVMGWPAAGLVLFGVPSGDDSEHTSHIYCYSEHTGRWSRWVMEAHCATRDAAGISLYIANADAWRLACNAGGSIAATTTGYDTSHSMATGWTYTAGTTTITLTDAQRANWTPEVGDWVSALNGDDTEYRRVSAVEDTGTSYTVTIERAFDGDASSAQTAYEAVKPVLEWLPHTMPDPFATCLFREVQIALDGHDVTALAEPLAFSVGGLNEKSQTATTKATSTIRSTAQRRFTLRAGIDREIARGTDFAPYLSGSNLLAPWHCDGVTVVLTPDGGDAERSTR